MRILAITAGAAGMYCGSCLRDNALAAELLARGHDVTLVPLYTPSRTDEPNVGRSQVLFGGISVYLQQRSAVFRRMPRVVDRLWDSPFVIRALASRAVRTDASLLGDLTVSMLQGGDGVLRKEFDKLIDWARREPPPDVITLPNSLLIALAAPLKDVLRRPVFCTLQGEELFLNGLTSPYRDEALGLIRRQVHGLDGFLAVSHYCARFMTSFLGLPPARVHVVPLGINMAGFGPRETDPAEFRIGYLARVAPEKGLHLLADAYVRFRRRVGAARVRLHAAGYMAPDQQGYLREIHSTIDRAGLGGEFAYQGELTRDAKVTFLRGLDVFSAPATCDDPKGISLLEAMACGVPVVQPRRGGFVEIVERTGGGLLVDPDDPGKLADGLHALWQDRALNRALGAKASEGVRAAYTVGHSARRLLDVFASALDADAPETLTVA